MGLPTIFCEKPKKRIALQKIIEGVAISIISIPFAVSLGTIISFAFTKMTKLEFVSDNAVNMVRSFVTNENNYSMDLFISIDAYSLLLIIALALALSLLSATIPIFTLIRFNSREIFTSAE